MATLTTSEYTRRVIIAFAIAAALFLIWKLGAVLMLTFGGIVLAVVIRLAADKLSNVLPLSERWAAVLVMVLIAAAIALGIYLFGSELGSQIQELRRRLPQAASGVRDWLSNIGLGDEIFGSASSAAGRALSLSSVFGAAYTTVSFLVDVILVLLVAIYVSFNPSWYVRGFLGLVPVTRRDQVRGAMYESGQALRGWLLGQLVSMLSVGVLTGLGLWLVGVPLALALGLIAGLLEFVPILGPWVAAVPGVLLAFAAGPTTALYAALVYVVVQQLEGDLIMPVAQRWAVRLPPALGLVTIVIFGGLFGLPGILFAVPLTVVLMTLVKHFYLRYTPEVTEGVDL